MKTLKDIVLFLQNIFTIIKTWIVELFLKYLFKNALMLGISAYLFFGLEGSFWTFWGFAVLFTWVGINIEAFGKIFRELKEKLNL